MKKSFPFKFVIATAGLAALSATPAQANLALAQKNACTACHAMDKKLIGPGFQEIAKKYNGQKDATAQLSDSIRKGGAGKWGPVPMPAQPNLSEADSKALAEWVLASAK